MQEIDKSFSIAIDIFKRHLYSGDECIVKVDDNSRDSLATADRYPAETLKSSLKPQSGGRPRPRTTTTIRRSPNRTVL